LRFKCLVLDHDDTVVNSTPHIHHPSMVETLKTLRPEMEPLSLETFIANCFHPGFSVFCNEILKFTEEEMEFQYKSWRSHTRTKVPDFYPGFPELIREFKEAGGIVCVASHSEGEIIARDYKLKCGMLPDMIFGWELGEERRKPKPYPLQEIMRGFGLDKEDILVVDDLKPGLDMARSCRVPFAAAGWSHIVSEIKVYMKSNSDYYFERVEDLREFIFSY
jgi:phosphoglycolate phosphatase-like HAD superfamily hydrolase